jgi:hypothetical protein
MPAPAALPETADAGPPALAVEEAADVEGALQQGAELQE